ncbi:MDR family MFS transporter [Clostridium saccharoperbutylacetonicum]
MENINNKEVDFWPVISSLFLGAFLTTLGTSTINLALIDLMKYFNTSLDSAKWALTGFMLATGTIAPLTSYLGEKFSYKRLYLISLIGFTLSSILCAFSWNIESLIGFRILQGAFNGLAAPATMTIIYQVIPRKKHATAISLWSLASMLAPAVGPTLSGFLIQTFSWKAIFLMNVPLGLIAIVIVLKFTPYYKLNPPAGFDFLGFSTSIIASVLLLTAFSEGASWGWLSYKIILLLIVGTIILSIFLRQESTTKIPALNLKIFKFKGYTMSIIVRAVVIMSLYAGTLLTPLYLQNVQHMTPLNAGLVMLIPSLMMALCMVIAGKLYNLMDPRFLVVSGIIAMAIGSLKMSHLSLDTSTLYIILWMTLRNVGIALSTMPVTNIGMSCIDRELSGNAASVNNWVGQSIGSLAIGVFTSLLTLMTSVHTNELSNTDISKVLLPNQAYLMGINDVYFISFIIILVALPLSMLLKEQNSRK